MGPHRPLRCREGRRVHSTFCTSHCSWHFHSLVWLVRFQFRLNLGNVRQWHSDGSRPRDDEHHTLCCHRRHDRLPPALCNGILAGLVSVTAPCSNVESGSAVLIGLLGGFFFVGSTALIKKLKIDDPVDAFSVHGCCGIWGCLAAALFDFGAGTDKHHGWGGFSATSYEEEGEVKYMTTGDAFAANLAEIAFVIVWSGGLSLVIFGALKATKLLRIDEETESSGMDTECASPTAYNIKQQA